MGKKDKCCKDGYQNLANVVSLFKTPEDDPVTPAEVKKLEAVPLVSTDSLDWDISKDFLTLICENPGIWHVVSTYQLKSLDTVGIGKIEAFYRVNSLDLMNTSNTATVLTPLNTLEDPTQRTIITTSIVRKFNKGDRLQFMVIGENNTNKKTSEYGPVNLVVSSLLTTMMRR